MACLEARYGKSGLGLRRLMREGDRGQGLDASRGRVC
jgi:hypothetical protein